MGKNQQRIEDLLIAIREHALLSIFAEEIGDMQEAQLHEQSARALHNELVQILLDEYQLNNYEPATHN